MDIPPASFTDVWKDLFLQIRNGIFITNQEGRCVQVNPYACQMLDCTQDEIKALSIHDILSDIDTGLGQAEHSTASSPPFMQEGWLKTKDAAQIPVAVSIYPLPSGQTAWVVEDITTRRQAEKALHDSETAYHGLFENIAQAIYVQDRDGRFLDVNHGAIEMYGYPKEYFIGKTPLDVGAPGKNDLEEVKRALERAFAGEPQQFEFWGKRSNGQIFPKEVRLSRGFYYGKEVVIALAQDITERKRAEHQLQEQADEIEALFKVSTALRSARSTDEALPVVLAEMRRVLNADAGAVVLLDADQTHFTITLSDGVLAANAGRKFASNQGLSGRVLHSRQPIAVDDINQTPERLSGVIGEEQIGPEAIVPILSETEVLGVLLAERLKGEPPFSSQEVRLLAAVGEMTGNTLRRTRLYDQVLNRQKRLQVLHNIDLAITSSVDRRVTLDVLLAEITTEMEVDAADVLLYNPQTFMLELAAARGMKIREVDRIRVGTEIAGKIAAERRILNIANPSQIRELLSQRKSLAAEDFTVYYGAPMIAKGTVIGVLEIFNRTPFEVTPGWMEFLEAVATQAAIAIENIRLFEDLQRAHLDLSLAYDATIEGWSRALDLRDKETEGHTLRVTELTLKLAQALRISDEQLIHIRRGALLHDIGKMGISDAILLKPGPLTESERAIIRCHPEYAYHMLNPIAYLRPAIDIPYCHHERWNGKGYPRGLKGERIPFSARIFAVVDVWDALTSSRPYRPAWHKDKALAYIQEQSGKEFDPLVVNAFLKLER